MWSMFINSLIIQFSLNQVSFLALWFFSFILFMINLISISYNTRNVLIVLLCIELLTLSISLNFIFFSLIHIKVAQVLALFILTVAATESAIGLGLLVSLYRLKQNISFKHFSDLRN